MKLAHWKFFGGKTRCYWFRFLQFGEGAGGRAVLDLSLDADYDRVSERGIDLSAFSLSVQVGGDALFQINVSLLSAGASIAIWSV